LIFWTRPILAPSPRSADGVSHMRLPEARGPLSAALFPCLLGQPGELPPDLGALTAGTGSRTDRAYADDDLQITLFACYALHYQGFTDVDDEWEWNAPLLALRRVLEGAFERSLRSLAKDLPQLTPEELPCYLLAFGVPTTEPGLPDYLRRHGTVDQYREFAMHRSVYNVMEADPHSWALPRITGRAKATLVEIQADEYGNGMPGRMHSELFQQMMAQLGLDPAYGRYLEHVPAISLATVNAPSMFGLHRRLRGALLGNLAIIEIGSSFANRCYSKGLERLGYGSPARAFFDEHVEADAVHEQLAAYNMCGAFAQQFPEQTPAVAFGALTSVLLGGLANQHMLDSWRRGVGSMRNAAAAVGAAVR
jgi:hypothetical protein